jgi:FAD/FMN-containing dehydrogenase/Fe-S oxidoreductase
MPNSSEDTLRRLTACEMRFDKLTRQLYATDASVYEIEPMGVAFPRTPEEVVSVVRAAAEAGVSITARGAGTGLAGGAVGEGLIVEFSRYNRQISGLDLERRTVRVQPGVVLDVLNEFLAPHGLQFGPDVATSSRATLGGMIANDSSGARVAVYGTTADHVRGLDVVFADGASATVERGRGVGAVAGNGESGGAGEWGSGGRTEGETGRQSDGETGRRSDGEIEGWRDGGADGRISALVRGADRLVQQHADRIAERMPAGLLKRRPGYQFDKYAADHGDLTRLLCGSEGTLGIITSAELNLIPLPKRRGLGLIFFASVADAMQATVELLDLQPAAIEHVDRILFDQTRGQLAFAAARALLDLDRQPCEAFLIVEFIEHDRPPRGAAATDRQDAGPTMGARAADRQDAGPTTASGTIEDKLAELTRRRLGLRTLTLSKPAEQALVWGLRKAGLALLVGRKGSAKPVSGIEDVAVRAEQLPEYVAGLKRILEPMGVQASFYGHALSGLLHVRPVLDLRTPEGVANYRKIADEVSALVLQFKGSIAGEHGVGIARTEYLQAHLGPELISASRELKRLFDPKGLLNPGKLVSDGRYRIDSNLRQQAGEMTPLPFDPVLRFFERDGSFRANLQQCNGNGACLKNGPTMCPTYIATHEEIMSTRGRANTIRAALDGRLDAADALLSPELEAALGPCLSCKACKNECPSNVDMALLKAELLYARHRRAGVPLVDRMIAAADWLGRMGTAAAPMANAVLRWAPARWAMEKLLGIARERLLPLYADERFDRWFAKRKNAETQKRRNGEGRQLSAISYQPDPDGGRAGEAPSSGELLSTMRTTRRVVLWDDTWVRYHEPNIGVAAVTVLEAAGYEVLLAKGRECCGRPAFSRGLLDKAAEMGRHNLALLERDYAGLPVIFLEPSCHAMFIDEYRQLGLPGAERVAERCVLFEQFMCELMEGKLRNVETSKSRNSASGTRPCESERGSGGAGEREKPEGAAATLRAVAIHAHCHAKALSDVSALKRLAEGVPGVSATLLNTGCCGMAGAYGMMKKNYALSLQVAEPLIEKLRALPPGTAVVASGTSCRQQIEHLTGRRPLHMAELLAMCEEASDDKRDVAAGLCAGR